LNPDQVKHGRENDHMNVLSLAADNFSEEQAIVMVDTFISARPILKEKYLRRLKKLDSNIALQAPVTLDSQ